MDFIRRMKRSAFALVLIVFPVAALGGVLGNVVNILWTALGLGLVIFIHELGHFAVAKWCNVNVERFSIGFGPILLGWKWGETEYALSAIPFGGYVKMLGQDDADPSQMTSEEIASDPRSYIAKTVWQRMAIISAGVTMNVITAVMFYIVAFHYGLETLAPVVGQVRPGQAAWSAGLQRGDRIIEFNGRRLSSFNDLALSIAVSHDSIQLKGERADGTPFETTVTPEVVKTKPQIGIGPSLSLTLAEKPSNAAADERPVSPGSAAALAEPPFEFGDTLKKIGGREVTSFAEFQTRLAARTGEPLTITVQRAGSGELVDVTVGASYFRTLGMRLAIGQIAAIQQGSPAAQAKLQVGDKIATINGRDVETEIDPLRLPMEFARLAGQPVKLVVLRKRPDSGPEKIEIELVPEDRPGWLEQPESEGEPLAIPAIGVAFHIVPFVLQVDPDGPAARAGVAVRSSIQKVALVLKDGEKDSYEKKELVISLDDATTAVNGKDDKANNFSFAFWMMQLYPKREVRFTLLDQPEKDQPKPQPRTVVIEPVADPSWPLPLLGLRMMVYKQVEKADSIGDACAMGFNFAHNTVTKIYLTLRSLLTNRLSYKELHGPVGIAQAAYQSVEVGLPQFMAFLGFLSLNLAVLNFLPIPVLDGGHMVFLVWEAVTGKRPNNSVLIGAQMIGIAFLLTLMGLVLFLDISRFFSG